MIPAESFYHTVLQPHVMTGTRTVVDRATDALRPFAGVAWFPETPLASCCHIDLFGCLWTSGHRLVADSYQKICRQHKDYFW